jgi:predicted acetyltransferase
MTSPAGYRRVDLPFSRRADVFSVNEWAFSATHPTGVAELLGPTVDWDRCRGIEADPTSEGAVGELAAVHSSFPYTMRVPGGSVEASGLTWVGVHPAHRRRGLLRSMVNDHLVRSRARGELVSTLVAAETTIYQRFGYGLACPSYTMTLSRGATFRPLAGSDELRVRFEDASLERHAPVIRAVAARDQRPGSMMVVSDALMAAQFTDPETLREGQERKRIAIVEDDEGPAAFALFQRKLAWADSNAVGTGSTSQWAAVTPAASRRLWSVLSDLDLMSSFSASCLPLDEPAVLLAEDIRGLDVRLKDHIWVRILDVPGALQARRYRSDLDLTIEVQDDTIAENSHPWRILVERGVATVTRAERDTSVNLRIDIQDLSAAYLGGTTIDALAGAGLVEETRAGVVSALSDAFRSPVAPRSTLSF